jgi:hypothetical protein
MPEASLRIIVTLAQQILRFRKAPAQNDITKVARIIYHPKRDHDRMSPEE